MNELDILYLLLPSEVALLTKNFQVPNVDLETIMAHQPIVLFAKNVQSVLFQILRQFTKNFTKPKVPNGSFLKISNILLFMVFTQL